MTTKEEIDAIKDTPEWKELYDGIEAAESARERSQAAPKSIQSKLDELDNAQTSMELLQLKKRELIDALLSPEIKAAMADIELEFAPAADALQEIIVGLTEEIKVDVAAHGETVKGSGLMAVWSKGRVTWDAKALDAMAKFVPQIKEARKEGQPVVSIKRSAGNA